ncbi:MAG: hypothetical protein U1F53_17890 [Burkholderiaceae bacterium]
MSKLLKRMVGKSPDDSAARFDLDQIYEWCKHSRADSSSARSGTSMLQVALAQHLTMFDIANPLARPSSSCGRANSTSTWSIFPTRAYLERAAQPDGAARADRAA